MAKPQYFLNTVGLSETDISKGEIIHVSDDLNATYNWDTGIAIGNYLSGLKQGILFGATCKNCQKTIIPPRYVCEWCYRPINQLTQLEDLGTVNTFSICYVTWDVRRISDPEIPAVIEIDGASPLHGILHKLGEVKPDQVKVGMRVKAVWKPEAEREGAITDILYFKPL